MEVQTTARELRQQELENCGCKVLESITPWAKQSAQWKDSRAHTVNNCVANERDELEEPEQKESEMENVQTILGRQAPAWCTRMWRMHLRAGQISFTQTFWCSTGAAGQVEWLQRHLGMYL